MLQLLSSFLVAKSRQRKTWQVLIRCVITDLADWKLVCTKYQKIKNSLCWKWTARINRFFIWNLRTTPVHPRRGYIVPVQAISSNPTCHCTQWNSPLQFSDQMCDPATGLQDGLQRRVLCFQSTWKDKNINIRPFRGLRPAMHFHNQFQREGKVRGENCICS